MGALNGGKSIRQIAKIFNCSKNTVFNVKKFGIERKAGSGLFRVPAINKKMEKRIEKLMRGKPGVGTRTVEKIIDIPRSTIQRHLKKQEWGTYRVALKVPGLSKKNIEDRKKFWNQVRKFGIKNMIENVAFSDEMLARLSQPYNSHNMGTRDFKKNRIHIPKFGKKAISLHVWAFISSKGSSKLYFLDGSIRINSEVYADILKFAKRQMEELGVKFLMEDGARCHSSNDSCDCRKELGIQVFLKKTGGRDGAFFWPGNSPDLNPIENAWSSLKASIARMKKKPKSKIMLKRALRYYWKEDEKKGLHLQLVQSMRKRLKKLKNKKFLYINY